MVEETLLYLWCLFLLAGLALFIRYEEVSWGEVSPLALLLFFIGIITLGLSATALLQPLGYSSAVAGLLLLVSLGALLVGFLARWTRELALGSSAAFLLALPLSALVIFS